MKRLPTANAFRRPTRLALLAIVTAAGFIHDPVSRAMGAPATPETSSPASADRTTVDIFAVRTWAPPPPPPPPPAAVVKVLPKRPEAPELPFRFIGKIADPDQAMAFLLAQGDRVLSVHVGDRVNERYLVEKYEGSRLYFIYQPLKLRQSLFVGSAS